MCSHINQEMNCPKATLIRSYLWVCLVLHALNKHALDNLHIMLLLVAKDSWEVPKEAKTNNCQPPVLLSEHTSSLTLLIMQVYGLNKTFGMKWTGAHQNMCRAASRRPTLSELTESNRNLSNSGHWLFPSSSRWKTPQLFMFISTVITYIFISLNHPLNDHPMLHHGPTVCNTIASKIILHVWSFCHNIIIYWENER